VEKAVNLIVEIAEASKQQHLSTTQIGNAVANMDTTIQQIVQGAEDSLSYSDELINLADAMKDCVRIITKLYFGYERAFERVPHKIKWSEGKRRYEIQNFSLNRRGEVHSIGVKTNTCPEEKGGRITLRIPDGGPRPAEVTGIVTRINSVGSDYSLGILISNSESANRVFYSKKTGAFTN